MAPSSLGHFGSESESEEESEVGQHYLEQVVVYSKICDFVMPFSTKSYTGT